MSVKFRDGYRIAAGLDPNVVRQRLGEIHAKSGYLTPSDVVEDARNPDSPIHSAFEWDDSKAAEQYRLNQARWLIKSICVTTVEDVNYSAFQIVVSDSGEKFYQPTEVVIQNDWMFNSVLDRLKKALRTAENELEMLRKLSADNGKPTKKIDQVAAHVKRATGGAARL